MSRVRSRRRYVAEIPIYSFGCKVGEDVEFGSERERKFSRVPRSYRANADRDGYIRFIHNPDLPLAALQFYCRNSRFHKIVLLPRRLLNTHLHYVAAGEPDSDRRSVALQEAE